MNKFTMKQNTQTRDGASSTGASSFVNSRGPATEIAMAPTGAVRIIARTATVKTIRARSLSPDESAASSATAPTAACTVALGSHARATNNRSFGFNENPRTAFDVAAKRKAPEITISATPRPASLPLITSRSTAAPNNEKSKGWATLDHKSPKTAPAALYKGPVRNASASAASAAAWKSQ